MRVPDFLIVGAARSGTSTLHDLLSRHPRIFVPLEKEPTFFSVYGQDWSYIDIRNGRKVEYIAEDLEAYLKLFSLARHDQLIGEASTWYLYFYEKTIENIKKIYGDRAESLRIIILLRNPVERAWSHYWLKKRNGEERLTFEEAIEPAVIRKRLEKRFVPSFDYIGFGKYWIQVKAYQRAFKRVKVLLLEDLARNLSRETAEIFEFLGVEPFNVSHRVRYLNATGRPKNVFYGRLIGFIYQPHPLKSSFRNLLPRRTRRKLKNVLGEFLLRREPMPNLLRKRLR